MLTASHYPIVFRKRSEIINIQVYILEGVEGRRELYLNVCIIL